MRYIIISDINNIQELIGYIDLESINIALFICYGIPFSKQNIIINNKTYLCYSYEYLEEAIKSFYFDCIIIYGYTDFIKSELVKLGVDKGKLFNASFFKSLFFSSPARIMNKILQNLDSYSIILTGMSYARDAFDQDYYSMKVATCFGSSQDLYYDYMYEKYLLLERKHLFSYSIISLAPYSLHYDLSLSKNESMYIPAYYLLFKDVHHYFITNDNMERLFSNTLKNLNSTIYNGIISPEIDLNDAYSWKKEHNHPIDTEAQLIARSRASMWNNKYFPNTLKENKKILSSMIELYLEYKCKPFLVLYPFSTIYKKFFNKRMIDEFYYIINKIIKFYNITFIDLYTMKKIEDSDFYNVDHLNSNGAKKVSQYLDRCISS